MIEKCAGVLVWRKNNDRVEFFMCSPGGPLWSNRESWNMPKGHVEDNESDFAAGIREFCEETGVQLSIDSTLYSDLGIVKQNPKKEVHVFLKKWDNEKLDDTCFSNTFEMWGKQFPEIGKYAWLTVDEIKQKGGVKSYYNLFENLEKIWLNC